MSEIHAPRKGRKNEKLKKKNYKVLTAIVTDEVTVSSPVSGGSSVTGGALIGGASSEPVLSIIKKKKHLLSLLCINGQHQNISNLGRKLSKIT